MTFNKKYYSVSYLKKQKKKRDIAPHKLEGYYSSFSKECREESLKKEDEKALKAKLGGKNIRVLDPERFSSLQNKSSKKEKQHSKTVQKRRAIIAEKGLYYFGKVKDKENKTAGKLFKWKFELANSSAWRRQHPSLIFFANDLVGPSLKPVVSKDVSNNTWRQAIFPESFEGLEKLKSEYLFCTGRAVYERNDTVFSNVVALEVYSVKLGFVYAYINSIRKV